MFFEQQIRMITEGSCDCSNDAEKFIFDHRNKLQFII